MGYRCIVPGCHSTVATPSFRFPKNSIRSSQWINAIKLLHYQNPKTALSLEKMRICYKHFSDDQWNDTAQRMRLSSIAIPNQNLPMIEEIDSGGLQNENTYEKNADETPEYTDMEVLEDVPINNEMTTFETSIEVDSAPKKNNKRKPKKGKTPSQLQRENKLLRQKVVRLRAQLQKYRSKDHSQTSKSRMPHQMSSLNEYLRI